MPKLVIWHKSSNNQAIQHESSLSFFLFCSKLIVKTNRFLVVVGLSSYRLQNWRQNVVRTSVKQPLFVLNTLWRHLWSMNGRKATWNPIYFVFSVTLYNTWLHTCWQSKLLEVQAVNLSIIRILEPLHVHNVHMASIAYWSSVFSSVVWAIF